jgi:hypothetical protein
LIKGGQKSFKTEKLNFDLGLRKNVFNQGYRSDAIGFDLAETFIRPTLECSDHISFNI